MYLVPAVIVFDSSRNSIWFLEAFRSMLHGGDAFVMFDQVEGYSGGDTRLYAMNVTKAKDAAEVFQVTHAKRSAIT